MADLVNRSSGLSEIVGRSLTRSETTLANEMEITRANARADIDPIVYKEFFKEFATTDPAALDWAFHEQRRRSPFFPAISEIHCLLAEWRIKRRELREEEELQRRRKEIATARGRGELINFADIVKQFQETAAKMPELEGSKRMREMTQRRVNTVIPAVQLTPEEIKARREKELAEIRLAEGV